MLNYNFYTCDKGSKIKNLRAGARLLQRYEMWAGVGKIYYTVYLFLYM
jgi:hypothetical protein